MPNLADMIARVTQQRAAAFRRGASPGSGGLVPLKDFGSNPGALLAYVHVPEGLAPNAALVVVLHGCTQTAGGYNVGAGWSEMADRHGFALLFPEQQRQNNPNGCFNWFAPDDSRRGAGEALSIRQMIEAMVAAHAIDPARIYVTGLSAGGAMASVMLATYPEVFAGGAIIAGLPFGCAGSVPQALERMRGQGFPSKAQLAAEVRGASNHQGPWPIVSIWHGSGDATVNPSNAEAIVDQWRALHGVATSPSRDEVVDGYPRRIWCDADGRAVVEEYSITGMGHGTPLDTAREDGCGKSGAYMLEASISSTGHICRFWGLLNDDAAWARPRRETPGAQERFGVNAAKPMAGDTVASVTQSGRTTPPLGGSAGKVIEDALRAAGLMQ